MSSLTGNNQDSLKKVLRTALVGIRPADQVMLKGYLRVLLRLEADLEWVSANHTHVDLFMISEEFRHAESVTKLLSSQTQKPVLYVSRSETGEGRITFDTIVLPLKGLNELNTWLNRHVPALSAGTEVATSASLSTSSNLPSDSSSQPSLTTPPSTNTSASVNQPQSTPSSSTSNSSTSISGVAQNQNSEQIDAQQYDGMIALIQQLQQRPQGLFELIVKGESVAIVEPSKGRLWQVEHTAAPVLSLYWQLQPYQGQAPDAQQARDLNQWLWNRAWTYPNDLLALISDNQKYHLRYWVKPNNSQDRRELLRLMTAMEVSPRSVSELADVAHMSSKSVQKAIVGLLLSGSLQPDNYKNIQVDTAAAAIPATNNATGSTSASTTPPSITQSSGTADNQATPLSDSAATPQSSANTQKLSPLDSVLAKRQSGEMPANTNTSSSTPPPAPQSAPAPEKKGFLSRLRQKLGI